MNKIKKIILVMAFTLVLPLAGALAHVESTNDGSDMRSGAIADLDLEASSGQLMNQVRKKKSKCKKKKKGKKGKKGKKSKCSKKKSSKSPSSMIAVIR